MSSSNPASARFSLNSHERLKREQHIHTLFRKGKAYSFFPVRAVVLWVQREPGEHYPIRAGFSAAKKTFRKAVHRNRIRRLMREAWRLQKPELSAVIPPNRQLHIFLIFVDSQLPTFKSVESAIKKIISQLRTECL